MKKRLFMVEYLDQNGTFFHRECTTYGKDGGPSETNEIVDRIISDYLEDHLAVYAIYEILGGLTFGEHAKLAEENPEMGQSMMNMLFYIKIP